MISKETQAEVLLEVVKFVHSTTQENHLPLNERSYGQQNVLKLIQYSYMDLLKCHNLLAAQLYWTVDQYLGIRLFNGLSISSPTLKSIYSYKLASIK